jgi:integrase
MSKSKSRKKKSPKRVLALPDLEHAKTAVLNSPTSASLAGGELDQIQFLLGHVSIQTTERYLGCKQRLGCAVNDRLGIEPDAA